MGKYGKLATRMKRYEAVSNPVLTPNSCVFVRVDGRAFHTFTRHCVKPFDPWLMDAMVAAAVETSREMAGFRIAYHQSDEVTFVLTDFDEHDTEGWFGYNQNKLVSITASLFTAHFNDVYRTTAPTAPMASSRPLAVFDARAFAVPVHDAPNNLVWRQQDWERNSLAMLAQCHFSHTELHGMKRADMHEMLWARRGINWARDLTDAERNGTFVLRGGTTLSERLDYPRLAHQILDGRLPPGELMGMTP
jgi:tRNA(His) guanylyltransferase